MPFYTVVSEAYDVTVYRTRKAMCADMARVGLRLETDIRDEPTAATASQIAQAVRVDSVVRLYPLEGGDWTYRIERHNQVQS